MTEVRLTRPVLATVVSIYEIVLFAFALFGFVSVVALHVAHSGIAANISMMSVTAGILSALFGLAGGVYLWQMRPAAGRMLAGKVVIDIIAYVLILTQPAMTPGHSTGLITGILGLILDTAIAWYAYKVTSTAPPQVSSASA